jgi:hypothetical protein
MAHRIALRGLDGGLVAEAIEFDHIQKWPSCPTV